MLGCCFRLFSFNSNLPNMVIHGMYFGKKKREVGFIVGGTFDEPLLEIVLNMTTVIFVKVLVFLNSKHSRPASMADSEIYTC